MNLIAKGPRVFIRPDALPEMSSEGLHLVYDRQHESMRGEVVAVGDGASFVREALRRCLAGLKKKLEGTRAVQAVIEAEEALRRVPNLVEPGDRVLFSPDRGQELFFEHDHLIVVLEDDILAVVDVE